MNCPNEATGQSPAPAEAPPAPGDDLRPAAPPRVAPLRRKRFLSRRWPAAGICAAIAVPAVFLLVGRRGAPANVDTVAARREVITHPIILRGDLEAVENTDIVCRVKAPAGATNATTIRWIIPDGTQVERGQLLVEFDDSSFQEDLKVQKTALDLGRADWVQAEQNFKIVQSQNHSDVKTAEVTLRLAELDLQKYLRGDYEQTRTEILGRLSQAETDLRMWQERAAWSQRMVRRGYASGAQGRAEQAKLQSADLAVKRIREELRVLEGFTLERTQKDLQGKVEEAKRALDRVRKQAHAKGALAEADRLAKEHIYRERLTLFHDTEDEIHKCRVYAPHDGLVVYFLSEKSRNGNGSQQSVIAAGEPVTEGQKLMRLPDLAQMAVHVRAHEVIGTRIRGDVWEPTGFGDCLHAAQLAGPDFGSRLLAQVAWPEIRPGFRHLERRLVSIGQPALIKLEAAPGRMLHGHVQRVGYMAIQESHWVDFKVYHTWVSIDETVEGLRPDMSAQVTVLDGADAKPVVAVPVRAIRHSPAEGNHGTCFVMTDDGPKPRDVVVGTQEGELAEICSGLEEGEEVILNPRTLP